MTSSQYSNLSEIVLFSPVCFFDEILGERRVCIDRNGNSANWRVDEKVLKSELFLYGGKDRSLCSTVQIVELHRNTYKHDQLLLLIIVSDGSKSLVRRTISNSKTSVCVATYDVNMVLALVSVRETVVNEYSSSEVDKKSTPFRTQHETIGSIKHLLLSVEKSSDNHASKTSMGDFSYSYLSQC